jgi:superfamily II DNA/RNA helicase
VEVTPVSSTAETILQSLYFVDKKDKRSLLLHVLKTQSIPTALVFTRTKHGADKVAQGLTRAGISAEAIHGNKSQNARQRALLNFKSRQTRILVATDIAARGIDIDELTHVINYELPNVPETYVHRIGRTGRAGASGSALSFCDAEEKEFLRDIEKLIGLKIPVVTDQPHPLDNYADAPAQSEGSQQRREGFSQQRNNGSQRRDSSSQRRDSSSQRRDNTSQRREQPSQRKSHSSQNPPQQRGVSKEIIRKGAVTSLAELEALENTPQQHEQPAKTGLQQPDLTRREHPKKHHDLSRRDHRNEHQQVDKVDNSKKEPTQQPVNDPGKREPQKGHQPHDPSKKEPVKREPSQDFLSNVKLNQSEGDEKW